MRLLDSGGSNTLAVYVSKPNLIYKCLKVKKLKPKENWSQPVKLSQIR